MSLKLTINKFSNIHILSSVPLYLRTHYGWMGLACLILDGLAVLISCWVRSVVLLLFCGQKAHTQYSHISRGQSMWKYATNWLDLTWLPPPAAAGRSLMFWTGSCCGCGCSSANHYYRWSCPLFTRLLLLLPQASYFLRRRRLFLRGGVNVVVSYCTRITLITTTTAGLPFMTLEWTGPDELVWTQKKVKSSARCVIFTTVELPHSIL